MGGFSEQEEGSLGPGGSLSFLLLPLRGGRGEPPQLAGALNLILPW